MAKSGKEVQVLWSRKEKRILFVFWGICLLIIAIAYFLFINRSIKYQNASAAYEGLQVPDSVVCMVSNQVKPIALNSIMVQNGVYWGCCDRCLNRLHYNIGNVQYAKDPYNGKTIKKCDAIIHISPFNKRTVLYFESNETYNEFLKIDKS